MKKILIGVVAVIVVLVLAAVVIPFVVPVETYKNQIVAQVRDATGREARIDGDFSLSILPRVEFAAGKVSLANMKGGAAPQMVTLDRMEVRVALLPLIGGNVEIDTFVLDKPVIHLEVDKAGRANWQFQTAAPATASGAPRSGTAKPQAGEGAPGVGLSGLKLGDVRLVDGRVTYTDARAGTRQQVDGINLKISLPSLDSPMKADGSLVWNKEKISLGFGLSNPNEFLGGKTTEIEANVSARAVKLSFKGTASGGREVTAGGALALDVPSIRSLAAWAGAPLHAPGSGYGPAKISGTVDVKGPRIAFRKAKLAIDQIGGNGDFTFDGGRKVPLVTARLALGKLDLNPYLPPEQQASQAGNTAPPKPGAAGASAASDWSDESIDLSALKSADADLDLTVEGIVVRKIKIGASNLKVALRNGKLVSDLTRMALYGGTGKATVTADAGGRVPAVALSFDLAKFQANPFMSDAIDFDRVEGTANADLSVTARGRSQRELISALNGNGKVQFLDGAIRGINLAAMVRNIKTAFLDSGARETQKTDFAELGGTYRIVNGILSNDDLILKSPLLRLTGKGTVDLPKRRVNYRIEPKVVATMEGQGGRADAGGINVPVIVSGPWHDLSYKPDLAAAVGGIAKDPKKALENLKKLVPGQSGSGSSAPSLSVPDAGDALKRLFGR